MFNQIRGSRKSVAAQMQREVERVYAKSLTRIVRKPRSETTIDRRPIWLACPDFPVPKHAKQSLRDVTLNDGRHIHGIALIPPDSRLNAGLDQHFEVCQDLYVRPPLPLRRIHAVLITQAPERATDYVLKALRRGRADPDDLIVLPRSVSQLGDKAGRARPIDGTRDHTASDW